MVEDILVRITNTFKSISFIEGIVLGGSRATGTETDKSDIDIGIYYRGSEIDYDDLNAIATELDDSHRERLICKEGEWGNWVNCGGWLVINGYHVDLIMREWSRVMDIVRSTNDGSCSCHYQTGHPHAFIDVMYRGELASCRVLYAKKEGFSELKRQAEIYPKPLRNSLVDFFTFEAGFSCMLAEKSAGSGDVYYITGHIFRALSALNQVLFAINEKWCLNEKKAVFRIIGFEKKPMEYSEKVQEILRNVVTQPLRSVEDLRELCDEVARMTEE